MKNAIVFSVGLLLAASTVVADEPQFSWSRTTLALIASGDPARGQEIAEKHRCKKCHGDAGVSEDADIPSIAGQVAAYQFKQLVDYKSGARTERSMNKIARKLTPEDMADLSAHYAAQAPAKAPQRSMPTLVSSGDMTRFLLPCQVCHGKQGEGFGFEVPALAGQSHEYLLETLGEFREGERSNDHYGRMRYVAKQLTPDEVNELAAYYAAVQSAE